MRLLFFVILFSPLFAMYESLKETLLEYKRPFSVLEIGAKEGNLALEIAREFPHAVVTIIERNVGLDKKRADLLFKRLEKERFPNVLLLNKTLTLSDLKTLSQVEHFDVVIARGLLSNIRTPKPFAKQDLLQIAQTLGDHLFLSPEEHTYSHQPIILQQNWFSEVFLPPLIRENGRSFHLESLPIPPFYRATRRIPGISLITFQTLRGSWPTKTWLREELTALPHILSKDLSPERLVLMGNDFYLYPTPSKSLKGLEFTLGFLDCNTQIEQKEYLLSYEEK